MRSGWRCVVAVVLLGAIAWSLVDLARGGVSTEAARRSALEKSVERYAELRRREDWKALYAMVDPDQRAAVSESRFLAIFGTPVVRFSGIDAAVASVEPGARRATARLAADVELVVAALPEPYRRVRVENDAALRQRAEHTIAWVWRGGAWYWQLEKEVAAGKDARGRPLAPIGADAKGG